MADTTNTHSRPRAPLFRVVRKIVDAVEDVVEGVVERGEDAEKDTRKLVHNLVREREEKDVKKTGHH